MAQKVNLDAMIPREDFGRKENEDFAIDLTSDFPISNLVAGNPIQLQLRKPDFQRETNHWTPDQIVTFIGSFLDKEVIPGLIFWKAESFIFVLDGGHRLSALRAWIEDDYGDGVISHKFYNTEITEGQKVIAKKTRLLVEQKIGRFSRLQSMVGIKGIDPMLAARVGNMFTRSLKLQWVVGSPTIAESSFRKINSQGTPLDEVESILINNRVKPVSIGARAIVRAGQGHKYWAHFDDVHQLEVEKLASEIFNLLFQPEYQTPARTLDVPVGGVVSPVDSMLVLIEFLTYSNFSGDKQLKIAEYLDDLTGDATIRVLKNTLKVLKRITGNSAESLGLHPYVYFYNENAKHSRFLFLGTALLISEKLKNNDDDWFKKFTAARKRTEVFLIREKSLISVLVQNMSKNQRIPKIRDLIQYLTRQHSAGINVSAEEAIKHLGIEGRIFDGKLAATASKTVSDDTKSKVYMKQALASAQKCPICFGLLDTGKAMHYDHVTPVVKGGKGDESNVALLHPYCNTGVKNGIDIIAA